MKSKDSGAAAAPQDDDGLLDSGLLEGGLLDSGLAWAFTDSETEALEAGQPELPARLDVRGEVARGGIGIVLRAHDSVLGRDVAIKILQERYAASRTARRRFVTEARITSQLQHPGVVPIYDLGLDGHELPWFTMKLVSGRSFADVLAARDDLSDDLHTHLTTFLQVCRCVAYAHANAVLHRDLKPKNIMVGDYGEVLVMDWGLAKHKAARDSNDIEIDIDIEDHEHQGSTADDATNLDATLVGSALGTPAYMAPEQARGDIAAVDARSDVFALGSILLEILSGQPLHSGNSALSAAKDLRMESVDARLAEVDADPELLALARACLHSDQAQRLASADDLRHRIESYLERLAARAREAEIEAASTRASLVAERRSRRLTLALASTGFLVVTLVSSFFLWRSRQYARLERDSAVARQEADALLAAGDFRAAMERLRSAEASAVAASASEDVLAGIRAFRVELEARARQDEVVERLERIRADPNPGPRKFHEYERCFADYELRPREHTLEEIVAACAKIAPANAVALAFEDWGASLAAQRPEAGWRKFFEVADALDPVPSHVEVRTLARALDVEGLTKLRPTFDPAATSARSALLYAKTLALVAPLDARTYLEAVVVSNRDEFWVHFELAKLYRTVPPERPREADLHAHIAEALSGRVLPRPGQRRHR